MPGWHDILHEINQTGGGHDVARKKYLAALSEVTGRNVIAYYSGWLQKPNEPGTEVNDNDKNGFMNAINKLDKGKGLDLILHTPGGNTSATESIVDYLRSIFGNDIRAIIPQLAMSAGTLIACSCKEIIMGKQSSLGPIDPQFGPIAAHGIIEEFKRAHEEIKLDHTKAAVWQPIIAKYNPTFIGECEKAIKWSEEMLETFLKTGMLKDDADADIKIKKIKDELGDHALTKSHSRHLSIDKCMDMGLVIARLEDDPVLQDTILSVHHTYIHTMSATPAYKIIENHTGVAFIQMANAIRIR